MRPRVIPTLLLKGEGLVKTTGFRNPSYVGDPVNAVRVFNEKEVDELLILDMDVGKRNQPPNFRLLADIASEAFMPMGYGGGIRSLEDARRIFAIGFEKIVVNSLLFDDPSMVKAIVAEYGNSGVVASIDAVLGSNGHQVYSHRDGRPAKVNLADHLRTALDAGVGEIFISAVERDGTLKGYDLELIRAVAPGLPVSLVASGGAGGNADFRAAIDAGASAAAASAMFVYYGRFRAVLIQYPETKELDATFA
jgi:cyclase